MSLIRTLFSDIFARQDNALARIDVRVKLVTTFALLLSVTCSQKPLLPSCVLIACFATSKWVGVPHRFILARLAPPLLVALVLILLKSYLNHVRLLLVAPIAIRCISAASIVLLLSAVTPVHRIFHGLYALGVPRGWVEIALFMYRYTFIFFEMAIDIVSAQRVRLGYSNLMRGMSSLSIAGGTLLIRSVDQAEQTNQAMILRGYTGDIPFGPMPSLRSKDWAVLILSVLMLLALIFATGVFGY